MRSQNSLEMIESFLERSCVVLVLKFTWPEIAANHGFNVKF